MTRFERKLRELGHDIKSSNGLLYDHYCVRCGIIFYNDFRGNIIYYREWGKVKHGDITCTEGIIEEIIS